MSEQERFIEQLAQIIEERNRRMLDAMSNALLGVFERFAKAALEVNHEDR